MRQFIYKPEHVGLTAWPPGTLRLEGIEETIDPEIADVFVVPGNIRLFEKSSGVLDLDKLYRLPYFKGNEHRTAFFDVSDNFKMPVHLPILFLKCDTRSWMLEHDPNTLTFAWPVSDMGECVDLPEGGFKYDIGFQGWVSSLVRRTSMEACQKTEGLKTDIAGYKDFYGHLGLQDGKKSQAQIELELKELARRRAEFLRSLKECRLQLCPESIESVFPYRYWETLSAGRVPLLIGSGFVFPFQDEIDYDQFTVKCARIDAPAAGEIALDFVRGRTDKEIADMGKLAREAWVKFHDSKFWPRLHSYAVIKNLVERGDVSHSDSTVEDFRAQFGAVRQNAISL